jgi:recombination protein RecA
MAKKDDKEEQKREEALERALEQIKKQFGKGAIMKMGEGEYGAVEGIPTGALSLDVALGGNGVPRGRVAEIFGPEASGKTTLCYHIMANAQKLGGVAAFIDVEHVMEPAYCRQVGLDLDSLLVSQPDAGEQALEIAELLIRSNAVDLVVLDSVAALVPRAELEGDMGDTHVGLQARLMSQALRKLTAAISKSRTAMIFTNQIRVKIGVMFGNPETTPGGRALKFYASVRIEVRRIGSIREGDKIIGQRVKAKVVKNKVAPPFRNAEFDILWGEGISWEGDLLDLGVGLNIVDKMGSWLSMGETRLGQGRNNARIFLKENKEVAKELEKAIREQMGLGTPTTEKQP